MPSARTILLGSALVLLSLAAIVRVTLGGGERLPDRSTEPRISFDQVEVVADLPYPPGNVAVAPDGRVFFTLHPDGGPPTKVHELVDGDPVPFPSPAWQNPPGVDGLYFQSILSLRIDRRNRLWVLDFADFGRGQPRLLAFDLTDGNLVHRHDFPPEVAGFASMLNDLQVSPDGRRIYIAETSPLVQAPALITYDVDSRTSRRLLEGHRSVRAEPFLIQAPGRVMRAFGLVALRIAVDSIALDTRGEWLYYGPVTGDRLYRVRTADLDDPSLDPDELAARVEDFAAKTLSDGLTMDEADNIYVSDMENSAIHTIDATGTLATLVRDERLRWPDGFSFGPDGWLYVTCSSLQTVLLVGESTMRQHAPYQIFRLRPGPTGVPGH